MPRRFRAAPLGCGLEGVLQHRRDVLSGIVNGVDYREWNPGDRPASGGQLRPGDGRRRQAGLQSGACRASWGCPSRPQVPLVAFIGRLVDQKGVDLVAATVRDWVQTHDVQWVVLGTGEPKYQDQFAMLAERFPQKVAVRLEFSNRAGPSHRGRRRHVPDAQPLRAVRPEPALQPQVRHGAGGAGHGRPGRHDHRSERQDAGRRHGQRLQLPRVQRAGPERSACSGPATRTRKPDDLEATRANRHAPGLVVGRQRPAVRRAVPRDGRTRCARGLVAGNA